MSWVELPELLGDCRVHLNMGESESFSLKTVQRHVNRFSIYEHFPLVSTGKSKRVLIARFPSTLIWFSLFSLLRLHFIGSFNHSRITINRIWERASTSDSQTWKFSNWPNQLLVESSPFSSVSFSDKICTFFRQKLFREKNSLCQKMFLSSRTLDEGSLRCDDSEKNLDKKVYLFELENKKKTNLNFTKWEIESRMLSFVCDR